MHTLDIIFLIISVIFVAIGIKRGFIGEIIRLTAMIAGFIIAFLYYNDLSAKLPLVKIPLNIKNTVSFFLIYIAVALLIISFGWIVKKLVHLTLLGWLDRLLGAAIGVSKALLITWAICLSISSFPARKVQADFRKSITYSTFKKLPASLTLHGISEVRLNFRKLFTKETRAKIDKNTRKLKKVKTKLDSI